MSSSDTSSESAVASAVEELVQAILKADGAALDALAAEGLTYAHSTAKVDDRETFLKKLGGEKPAFQSIEIGSQSILIAGSTGVVRHTFKAVTGDGGEVNLHNLLIFSNQSGAWKLLARQAVKLP